MIVLLLLTQIASAREFAFTKPTDTALLQKELRAAGFQVDSISCLSGKCFISMPDSEQKDPRAILTAHVYQDPEAARIALLDELAAIEDKCDDATATMADLRRGFKLRLKLDGLARRP